MQTSPNAEFVVIRAAYRSLSLKYHPDTTNVEFEEANQFLTELNKAHEILSDHNKRERYDQLRLEHLETELDEPEAQFTEPPNEPSHPSANPTENNDDWRYSDLEGQDEIDEKYNYRAWHYLYGALILLIILIFIIN